MALGEFYPKTIQTFKKCIYFFTLKIILYRPTEHSAAYVTHIWMTENINSNYYYLSSAPTKVQTSLHICLDDKYSGTNIVAKDTVMFITVADLNV